METQFNDGEFHVCAELKERRYKLVMCARINYAVRCKQTD